MIRCRLLPLAATFLLAACGAERVADTGPTAPELRQAPALSGSLERDRAELGRLEAAAAALARADGCDAAESCATIAVGAKACGGPRYYLTYCRLTTSETLLRRQVEEIERFERAMNERYAIGSTCDFVGPPVVEAAGGSCRAARP